MQIFNNISLLPYNTFRMDVKAATLAEYDSVEELRTLLERYRGQQILHIGQGSNLLFTKDFEGVVLRSRMVHARALGENGDEVFIEAENGLVMDELIDQIVDMGLVGMENLSHIPGTAGASAVQNVGAYGVEAKDIIVEVHTLDIATGDPRTFTNEECRFGYRDSIFKNELKGKYIVTSVVYRLLKHGDLHLDYGNLRSAIEGTPSVSKVRQAVIDIRRQKLPEVSDLGSAGSFFKNPVIPASEFERLQAQYPSIPHYTLNEGKEEKIPAAWLIEQCGWKGKSLGGARVYEKQPLVIVNSGTAVPQDIIALAQEICDSVKQQFGVTISPEVNYI